MSVIKIKYFQLFEAVNLQNVNKDLAKLIFFPAKSAALKYDISIKLAKEVYKEIKEFHEFRMKLLEELAVTKKVLLHGAKDDIETKFTIVDAPKDAPKDSLIKIIDGTEVKEKKVLGQSYDLGDNMEKYQKQLDEILNKEIELECYPIKLSKLENEDCTDLNFVALESFIDDDRSTEKLSVIK